MSADVKLGSRGERLIKSYETLKLVAYMPTPNDRPTIGWGHTKDVKIGQTISLTQAQAFFDEDMADAVAAVSLLVKKAKVKLTQSMVDAIISLVFNVGPSAVQSRSTIGSALIEKGDYYLACQGFFLWRKQAGRSLLGLARRRAKEMELFLEDGIPKD